MTHLRHFAQGAVAGVAPVAALGLVLVIAEVLVHLLIEHGLDHRLGQRLEQPVRAGQCHPAVTRLPHQLARGLDSSVDGC